MSKLSFNLGPPVPPHPFAPAWFRVVLYASVLGLCGALVVAAFTG